VDCNDAKLQLTLSRFINSWWWWWWWWR